MSPERWRVLDAVLQSVLAAEPARREAIIAEACRSDEALRRDVESLLAAHARAGDGFLERPAAESLGGSEAPRTLAERLAIALAGRYEIVREIARGGMAVVHLARDVRHDRRVAIKVVRQELAAAVGAERFLEEIRVTASLQHPHVLPLFDSGSADDMLWYVMPFAEGETLRSRLEREGRMPVDVALRLAREMADALEYAHARGGTVAREERAGDGAGDAPPRRGTVSRRRGRARDGQAPRGSIFQRRGVRGRADGGCRQRGIGSQRVRRPVA
jgi:serine/threonine-protein kinase